MNNTNKVLVGVVYRASSSPLDNDCRMLTALSDLQYYQPHSHLLLMGDFDLPNIDWVNNTVTGGNSTFTSQLFNATQDALLTQHSLGPMRHRPG